MPRKVTLPAGIALTREEALELLRAANERKKAGLPLVEPTGTAYTLQVPVGIKLRLEDLRLAVAKLNAAAEHGYSDVLVTFADGVLVKCWVTLKDRPGERARLRVELGP